jgi:hypothetical protein
MDIPVSEVEGMILSSGKGLVNDVYLRQGSQGLHARRSALKALLASRSLPHEGLDDMTIEIILSEMAAMDSNNFPSNCGLGEREGRIYSVRSHRTLPSFLLYRIIRSTNRVTLRPLSLVDTFT